MIYGSYNQKISWSDYRVDAESVTDLFTLRATHFSKSGNSNNYFNTCGSSALSLLTGLTPKHVSRQMPNHPQKLWSTTAAIKFLKNRGFQIREVSRYGVTNLDPNDSFEWQYEPITSKHVLLCDLLMCRDEASWWVVHNNITYHNFSVKALNPLLFCNKPSQAIFLVTHPKWPRY